MRIGVGLVVVVLLAAACTAGGDLDTGPGPDAAAPTVATGTPREFPPAPEVPTGPLDEGVAAALDEIAGGFSSFVSTETIEAVGASDDARVLWPLADMLRFVQGRPEGQVVLDVFEATTGVVVDPEVAPWTAVTDHLIAWDLPAPPGYVAFKQDLFTQLEEGWEPFFADDEAEVDWRLVSWGGVLIDDRPLGEDGSCPDGCIPALDDPAVTDAAGGDWYADDGLVFAVEVDGAARAYPRHIMEIHEMVNDTVGGVRLGIPYCTLCGAAQAYVTDGVAGTDRPLVLRTSGLLNRSNKVMYDLDSDSVLDTFTGEAVTGPLRERGVRLEQVGVVTTTWGEWKQAHPDTTIVAQDGGIGRDYELDPLGGRDDDGPIFPVGDVDARLPVQEQVVGVELGDGSTVAFPADAARVTLGNGGTVEAAGVRLVADGGGLRAETTDGGPLASNQAFWFAWSQFHPDTILWQPGA